MSIQFKPFRKGEEENYDNLARGLRTTCRNEQIITVREYEQYLAEFDLKWAKEGEP